MQVAVCCPGAKEAHWICRIIEERARETGRSAEAFSFPTEKELWDAFAPGRFRGAVIGYGDVQGFLCARRVREEDGSCRVILLDDTDRYAIRGLRIHVTDFLVRPLEDRRFRAAADQLLTD